MATHKELKNQWRNGPPTEDMPCGGCKHVVDIQGYHYSCSHPDRTSCYYGFRHMPALGPTTWAKICWEDSTGKPKTSRSKSASATNLALKPAAHADSQH